MNPSEWAEAFAEPVGLKEGEHYNRDEIRDLIDGRWTSIKSGAMEGHIVGCPVCYDVWEDIMASRVV